MTSQVLKATQWMIFPGKAHLISFFLSAQSFYNLNVVRTDWNVASEEVAVKNISLGGLGSSNKTVWRQPLRRLSHALGRSCWAASFAIHPPGCKQGSLADTVIKIKILVGSWPSWYEAIIRELKQTRRRRKRERHLKMQLRVSAINF